MKKLFNLKITPFQTADTQKLTDVINNVCADTSWMQTTRFEPTPAWQHALENEHCPDHLLALASVYDQIIGWCRLFPVGDYQSDPVELGIGVLSPYRHRGIGTSMMAYAIEWAKSRSVNKIMLTTHSKNVPAIGLFNKFGFLEKGREGGLLRMGLNVGSWVEITGFYARYGYVHAKMI